MRLSHFEALKPHCLVCGSEETGRSLLRLDVSFKATEDQIIEGILHCSNRECQYEYPIIDGVPILVPNTREFLAANSEWILTRDDLDFRMTSLLRDCGGQEGALNQTHQQLSSYGWCHYGDLDPEVNEEVRSTASLLHKVTKLDFNQGAVVDLGCSVGRTTFEIAQATAQLTLGIDLNLESLRLANRILRNGKVSYPYRRYGVVYDQHIFPVDFGNSELVDFWACDVHHLPFANSAFANAVCLNTLDSVTSPVGLLQSIAKHMASGGQAVVATPFDWNSNVTPIEGWIGGHSQRAEHQGECVNVLKQILNSNAHSIDSLQIDQEIDELEWVMRVHDRGRMVYRVYSMTLRKN